MSDVLSRDLLAAARDLRLIIDKQPKGSVLIPWSGTPAVESETYRKAVESISRAEKIIGGRP